ncbi:MAG: molybdate ABC transporter substrate-binding protein, partial [Verrucomicrobiota bacterium]
LRAFLLVAFLSTLSGLVAADISVFAAASLTDAMKDLAALYKKNTGDTIKANLAASNTLVLQIKEGAPADIFFSADEAKMDDLAKARLIDLASRRSLFSNALVIVVAAEDGVKITAPADLANAAVRRLALAEPQTVPAGIYAKEYLQKINLWKAVIDKTVPTDNVRAALAAVESGNVDAAIVYKTDALISKKVRVAFEVPLAEGPKISYPVALAKTGKNPAGAAKFLALLASPEGKAIFQKYGFIATP